ncbi:MAG: hypothetical protein JNL98_11730 [Bryobacterales bacterium]|nr:hypothetical protein [Bryobacterales bacterium]
MALYVAFVAYTATDGWNGVFYSVIIAGGTATAVLMRRWHRKQDEILNTPLTGQSRLSPLELAVVSPDVRAYLQERALIVASLLGAEPARFTWAATKYAGCRGKL